MTLAQLMKQRKQRQAAARILTEYGGGSQSGKKGFKMYRANVRLCMAPIHGLRMMHSIQSLIIDIIQMFNHFLNVLSCHQIVQIMNKSVQLNQ